VLRRRLHRSRLLSPWNKQPRLRQFRLGVHLRQPRTFWILRSKQWLVMGSQSEQKLCHVESVVGVGHHKHYTLLFHFGFGLVPPPTRKGYGQGISPVVET
jgi:hypothetical protein